MKVIIEIRNGIAEPVLKDKGVELVIRDYDNKDDPRWVYQEISYPSFESINIAKGKLQ